MHPILAQRTKLGLYLAVWLLLALLFAVLAVLAGNLSWLEALLLLVPMMLLYAFVCLSTWYLCRAFTLERSSVVQLLSVHLAAALLSAALWFALGKLWAEALSQFPRFAGLEARYMQHVALWLGAAVLLFWLMAVVHYLLVAFEDARQVEKRLLQFELLAREAELRNLKAQIHPHFLFNSLHSINALTLVNARAAREMCLRLSEFLRKSLAIQAQARIPFAQELQLLEDYLAIEQIRFGARLRVERNLAARAEECLVPALLLQPLAENAVNHGIAHLVEGGTITLHAQVRHEQLEIMIANPYDAEDAPRKGEGVGLQNVSKRLAALYGGRARLACTASDGVFCVQIILPIAGD